MLSDRQLAIDARAGDVSAYAELTRRWSGPVLALCRRRLRCRHAAEDSAQEAFLRGWKGIEALQAPDRFGSWLMGIAHRVCLDWLKRKQNQQTAFSTIEGNGEALPLESREPDAVALSEKAEEQARLIAEIERLPESCQEVLLLYYTQELTYAELAARLGIAVATVNQRLAKSKRLLRIRLAEVARCDR